MPFQLPTTIIPATETSPLCTIIYGAPKIGKTAILAALPNNLLVDAENGSDYTAAMKVKVNDVMDFEGFEEAVKKAGKPYDIISWDTLDALEEMCEKEATRRYKTSVIGKNFGGKTILELPNGGGYLHLRNVFYEYMNRIRRLARYTIFVGHVRDKYLGLDSKEAAAKDLDLTGKVRNITCAYADAIAHAYRDKTGVFYLSFKTTDLANCGSRCGHLAGQEFRFSQPATVEDWKQIYKHLK